MSDVGFNRNIMECKGTNNTILKLNLLVLIETLWNVKMDRKDSKGNPLGVLIETLWNVKYE